MEGQVVTVILELWSGQALENLWTLIPITVTFLMVLRAGTTAMDWVRHLYLIHTKLPLVL